jgi:hypothetical protein
MDTDERNVVSIMELHDLEIGHIGGRLYVAFPNGHTEWPVLQGGRVLWDQSFLVPREVKEIVGETLKEEANGRAE